MKERFLASIYRTKSSNALGLAAGRLGDPDLINLSLGDPDFITPQEIIDEAFTQASQGHTRYTKPAGDPELIDSIRSFVHEEYQADPQASEIMVTVGACHAMYVAMCAILDEGDEVIVPDPYFVPYYEQITMARGKFVSLPTRTEDDFELDLELLETLITPKTKAVLINSPNNPTGAVYAKSTLEKLGVLANQYNFIVLSDEVYEAISFHAKHVSVLEIPTLKDRSIVFGSFSKSYAMTGWRIGYAIAPDFVIRTMVQINESICFSAPSISQRAAITAIKHRAQLQPRLIQAFQERMEYGYERINETDILHVMKPKGGIYLFVDIRKTKLSSDDFARLLLEKQKVLVLPGHLFGEEGEGFIRIAVTVDLNQLKTAFDRIEEFMKTMSI